MPPKAPRASRGTPRTGREIRKSARLRRGAGPPTLEEDAPGFQATFADYGFIGVDEDEYGEGSQLTSQKTSDESQASSVAEMMLRCYEDPLGSSQQPPPEVEEAEDKEGGGAVDGGGDDEEAKALFTQHVSEYEFSGEASAWERQLAAQTQAELDAASPLQTQLQLTPETTTIKAVDPAEVRQVLRSFDLNSKFGPCLGIPRKTRWQRADKFGLAPPSRVYDLLAALDEHSPEQIAYLTQEYPSLC